MAKKRSIQKGNVTVTRSPLGAGGKPVIISNIIQSSVDRTPKDIRHFTTSLQAAESIFNPMRVALYDIYARLIMDAALTGVWDNKRVAKVCNKLLKFKAAGKDKDEFTSLIKSKKFREFVELIMQQKAWGLKGAEFITGPGFDWQEIPVKHINAHKKIIVKYQYDQSGTSYEGLANVMVLGNNDDLGFLYKVAPLILYKQGNWGDWAQFIEKYGQPFQQFTYDIYDEASRKEAFNMAQNAGSSLAIVIPKQIEFDVKDGKQTNADGKLQDSFRLAINEEIRFAVVGNNLTSTNAGGGSYSLGEVQKEDQDDITNQDMADVLEVLNSAQFLAILQSYGYPVDEGAFEFDVPIKAEDLKADMEIDSFLVSTVGLPLDDDYYYQKYGRPKPTNYNELKQKKEEDRAAMREATAPARAGSGGGQGGSAPPPRAPKSPKNQPQNLGWWDSFRVHVADFFDLARKG